MKLLIELILTITLICFILGCGNSAKDPSRVPHSDQNRDLKLTSSKKNGLVEKIDTSRFVKELKFYDMLFSKFWAGMSREEYNVSKDIMIKSGDFAGDKYNEKYLTICGKHNVIPEFEDNQLISIKINGGECLYNLYKEKYKLEPLISITKSCECYRRKAPYDRYHENWKEITWRDRYDEKWSEDIGVKEFSFYEIPKENMVIDNDHFVLEIKRSWGTRQYDIEFEHYRKVEKEKDYSYLSDKARIDKSIEHMVNMNKIKEISTCDIPAPLFTFNYVDKVSYELKLDRQNRNREKFRQNIKENNRLQKNLNDI